MTNSCENRCPKPVQELPVMVDCADQTTMGPMYGMVQALLHGTLFQQLNKPLCNEQLPICDNHMDLEQALNFCLWELKLYLDTHPNDRNAMETMRDMQAQARQQGCNVQRAEKADLPWTDGCHPEREHQPEPACSVICEQDCGRQADTTCEHQPEPACGYKRILWPWEQDEYAARR